jgi:hypothetical protein
MEEYMSRPFDREKDFSKGAACASAKTFNILHGPNSLQTKFGKGYFL